jgi:hypothetical protein
LRDQIVGDDFNALLKFEFLLKDAPAGFEIPRDLQTERRNLICIPEDAINGFQRRARASIAAVVNSILKMLVHCYSLVGVTTWIHRSTLRTTFGTSCERPSAFDMTPWLVGEVAPPGHEEPIGWLDGRVFGAHRIRDTSRDIVGARTV